MSERRSSVVTDSSNIPMQAEQPVRKVSKSPTKSSKQESRAVFLSVDVTSSALQQKRFGEQTRTVRGKPTKKRRVELSVKNLSQDNSDGWNKRNKTRYDCIYKTR